MNDNNTNDWRSRLYDVKKDLKEKSQNQSSFRRSFINNEITQSDPFKTEPFVPYKAEQDDGFLPSVTQWRQLVKRVAQGNVDSDDSKIQQLYREKAELQGLQELRERLDYWQQLNDFLAAVQSGEEQADENTIRNAVTRKKELEYLIEQQKDYYRNEGRSSDMVVKYMYDLDKLGNTFEAYNKSIRVGLDMKGWAEKAKQQPWWKTILSGAGQVLNAVHQVAGKPIGHAIDQTFDWIFDTDYEKDWRTNIIQSIPDQRNRTSGYDDKIQQIVDESFGNKEAFNKLTSEAIAEENERLDKQIELWKARKQIDKDFLDNGRWHPLWYRNHSLIPKNDYATKISDPDKITPEQEQQQQDAEISFWAPNSWKYAIPELGSSISMADYSIGSIAGDVVLTGAGKWLGKKLPAWLGKPTSKFLSDTPGKVATGLSLSLAANNVGKSRATETAMEAIQAQTDRVLEESQKNQANFPMVGESIRRQLREIDPDIDVNNFTAEDYARHALVFNLKTGDAAFDAALDTAHKGINQLINTNNALAVADYLELLPFLDFGGKLISNTASKVYHGVSDPIARYTAKKFTSKTAQELEKVAAPKIRAAYGKIVDAATRKLAKVESPAATFAAIKANRILKDVGSGVAKLTTVAAEESAEEGVQELLQARYGRGEYDAYENGIQRFSVPEVFNTVGLAKQALLDYLGLDPSDPENGSFRIQKAMQTGAAAGVMMSMMYGAAGRSLKSTYRALKGNPFEQTRADWAVADLISNDFERSGDISHLGIYYDMYNRGKRGAAVQEALATYKKIADGEDGLVTKKYVQDDADLAEMLWRLYDDNDFNSAVEQALADPEDKSKGKRGTEEHKSAMVEAAKKFKDAYDAEKESFKDLTDVTQLRMNRQAVLDRLLSESTDQQDREQLEQDNPNLVRLVSIFDSQYQKYVQQKLQNDDDVKQYILKYYPLKENESEEKLLNRILGNSLARREIIENSGVIESRRAFISNKIQQLQRWNTLQVYKILQKMFKNRAEINKNIRKFLGIDLDTSRTLGMADAIENEIKRIKVAAGLFDGFDLSDPQSTQFDNQDEENDIITKYILNHAVYSTLSDILSVYNSKRLKNNPGFTINSLKNAIFGGQEVDDSELNSLLQSEREVNEFENPIQDISPKTAREYNELDSKNKQKKRKNLEDAFKWLVKRDARLPEQRRFVAHKSFEDAAPDSEQDVVRDEIVPVESVQPHTPDASTTETEAPETPVGGNVEQPTGGEQPQVIQEGAPEIIPGAAPEPADEEKPTAIEEAAQELAEEDAGPEDYVDEEQNQIQPEELSNEYGGEDLEDAEALPLPPKQVETADGRTVSDDDPDAASAPEEVDQEEQPALEDIAETPLADESVDLAEEDEAVQLPEEDENVDFGEEDEEIDYTKLHIEADGDTVDVYYDGEEIKDSVTKQNILNSLNLLDGADGININTREDGAIVQIDDLDSIVANTFFYQPEPEQDESGQDQLAVPSVGDKPIELKYKLHSGRELSLKLEQKGWLHAKTTKKYYVVGRPAKLTKDSIAEGSDVRDALVVAMIIEDNADKKCYAVYLKSLGKYSQADTEQQVDQEALLRSWMASKNADWFKITQNGEVPPTKAGRISAYMRKYRQLMDEYLQQEYKQLTGTDVSSPTASEKAKKHYKEWYHAIGLSAKEKAERAAIFQKVSGNIRKQLSIPNAKIILNPVIDSQINKLRDFRNQIISAVLGDDFDIDDMSTEYNDSVTPSNVEQSSGRLNNVKINGVLPAVFSIAKGSIEDITNLIKKGAIRIGIGRGFFGNPAFGIFGALDAEEIIDGRGLSGKLYQILQGVGDRGESIPAMLIEQKFITQHMKKDGKLVEFPIGDKSKIKLCLTHDGRLDPTAGDYLPSAAEAILHILCGRVPGMTTGPEVAEFFLHNGDKTILKNQQTDGSPIMNAFARKQIRYNPSTDELEIAMQQDDGSYSLQKYAAREIFENPDLKLDIVHAIATQMHWNTEKDFIQQNIRLGGSSMLDSFFTSLVRTYVDLSKPLEGQRISILNCPQLSFDINDFADSSNGQLDAKQTSVLAWLIKEQKVYTDVDPERQFVAPFVYASGVEQRVKKDKPKNPEIPFADQQGGEDSGDDGPITSAIRSIKQAIEDWYESVPKSFLNVLKSNKWLADDDKSKDQFERQQDHRGGLIDNLLLVPYKKQGERTVKETFQRISDYIKQNYDDEIYQNFLNKKEDILKAIDSGDAMTGFNSAKGVYQVSVTKSKQVQVVYLPLTRGGGISLKKSIQSQQLFSGVFSTRKAVDKALNAKLAKQWLQKYLGINEDQIVISNFALNSMSSEPAYGAMQLSMNRIKGILVPFITLSTQGEYGLEYHEAFHFVNLLIHDRKTRMQVYQQYVNKHKEAQDMTFAEIEEKLADMFMDYMRGFDQNTSTSIGRFFRNILDCFMSYFRHENSYNAIFSKIRKMGYVDSKLDLNSVKEFQARFPNGVNANKFHVAGATQEQIDSLQSIKRAQDFYTASNAIINEILYTFDFSTLESIRQLKLNRDNIKEVIDRLVDRVTTPLEKQQLMDLAKDENWSIVFNMLKERLSDIGIKIKQQVKESSSTTDRETANDDKYNWFAFEYSRKDNATNGVKLLLATLPKESKTPDGTFIQDRDEYGAIKLWDQTEVYNKLIKTAWDCTSYDKMDGSDYDAHSLLGIVKTHAQVDRMFHSLWNMLQVYSDNSNLKSQLLSTINSSLQQISFFEISDLVQEKRQYSSADEDDIGFDDEETKPEILSSDGKLADRNRMWKLLGDRTIRVAKSLPRQWSAQLLMNGLVEKGSVVVSKQYKSSLKKLFEEFNTSASNAAALLRKNNTTQEELETQYNKALELFQQVLAKLSIPADRTVVETFIQSKGGFEKRSLKDRIKVLYATSSQKTIGSIKEVVYTICDAGATEKIKNSASPNIVYTINELLSRRPETSDIGLLANAYDDVHPSASEFSVLDTNNNRLYPVSQNSHHTATIRTLNSGNASYIQNMRKYKYCGHSMLLDAAEKVNPLDVESKIQLMLFVGLKDADRIVGNDYFGISAKEDIISKMFLTERSVVKTQEGAPLGKTDVLIDPTMADKPTYYGATSPYIKLFHFTHQVDVPESDIKDAIVELYTTLYKDKYSTMPKDQFESLVMSRYNELKRMEKLGTLVQPQDQYEMGEIDNAIYDLISYETLSEETGKVDLRFHDDVINLFSGYVLDEINALIDYYSKENIKHLVDNPSLLLDNYHGKVKDGRMLFGGNGGLMRYFYDVFTFKVNVPGSKTQKTVNLNQYLQGLWELQKKIENGDAVNRMDGSSELVRITDLIEPGEDLSTLDGFELIRKQLKEIKDTYFIGGLTPDVDFIEKNLRPVLNNLINNQLKQFTTPGQEQQLGIFRNGYYEPTAVPVQLLQHYLEELGDYGATKPEDAYNSGNKAQAVSNAFISLIANYTLNSMVSTIEIEKVVTGDPAFYQYKKSKKNPNTTFTINWSGGQSRASENVTVDVIDDMATDKIKRLGSTLSPGDEMRVFNSEEDLELDPTLGTSKYSVLDINDVKTQSSYIEEIKDRVRRQLVVDIVRHGIGEKIQQLVEDQSKVEEVCSKIYVDDSFYHHVLNDLLTNEQRKDIESRFDQKSGPYDDITVTDAQTIISPAFYRRIRIGLGMWSGLCPQDEQPEEGTDEWAYRVIEQNDNWMHDKNIAKAMRKFELFPLKMVYFQNDPVQVGSYTITLPQLYKMAMFPLFKFHRSTPTGRRLYERMNNDDLGRIDMVAFKSAVKVGAVQRSYDPTQGAADSNKLDFLNQDIENPSSVKIDYAGDKTIHQTFDDLLSVKVEDLSNLRMQLNTHSHDEDERAIGTQILKIAFSNIVPNAEYKMHDGSTVSGSDMILNIMQLVNELTDDGVETIKQRFVKDGIVDTEQLYKYLRSVVQNNGLGFYADELLEEGGVIESLSSNTVFEQSVSAMINREVVNVPTQGGSAIQQSVFGFVGYQNGSSIATDDKYVNYNEGKALRWLKEDNSMEVMLSIKFFRSVVPYVYQRTYEEMRQWLIDHGMINGKKSNRKYLYDDEIFEKPVDSIAIDLEDKVYTYIKSQEDIKTVGDLFIAYSRGKLRYSDALKSLFNKYNIEEYSVSDEFSYATEPFGLGYRIPTQGMSSSFAFTVADVLPNIVGDLIVVPEEFTAQTGSDFDVDKIFIATFAYKNGKKLQYDSEQINDKKQISNALLQNYINIITDPKNFAVSRGSIDVLTTLLKDVLVNPILRQGSSNYATGGYQLMPAFQARKKSEFASGKNGISVFALNVTNLAFTQAMRMQMLFGDDVKQFDFKQFDDIYGKDLELISDWLSAMVNIHVDVAKDPIVFDVNVNQFTYNHTAFLLRTGNGLSTFTFLSQPALVEYANVINNAGGIYGDNIDGTNPDSDKRRQKIQNEYIHYIRSYLIRLYGVLNNPKLNLSKEQRAMYDKWTQLFESISAKSEYMKRTGKKKDDLKKDVNTLLYGEGNRLVDKLSRVFSIDEGIQALSTISNYNKSILYKDNVSSDELESVADAFLFQLQCLYSFNVISPYAEHMSDLVHLSQIDTKKFGNTITTQRNYLSRILDYVYSDGMWGTASVINSSYTPIEHYFLDTFLYHKFSAAHSLMQALLKTQTFSAQPLYWQLFQSAVELINGRSRQGKISESAAMITAVKGDLDFLYSNTKPLRNTDDVVMLDGLLRRVLQFNSMFNSNLDQLREKYNISQDTVDLSFDGNLEQLQNYWSLLLFGTDRYPDIFQRTNDIIKKINESDDIEYDDLKIDGEISNEFLNFIAAIPSRRVGAVVKKLGTIQLKSQLSRVTEQKKIALSIAFEQLLEHENPEIRKWARDLVIYSYYSSTNRNTYNSFFEIVPMRYRRVFDFGIKDAIQAMITGDEESIERLGFKTDVDSQGLNATDILDVIYRNNWSHPRLVPIKYDSRGSRIFHETKDCYLGIRLVNGVKYWKAVLLNKYGSTPSSLYIRGKDGQLYRLAGTITRNLDDKKTQRAIYLPTEKAGLDKIQEPYAKFGVASIFPQNALPEELQEQATMQFVEDTVRRSQDLNQGAVYEINWNFYPVNVQHVSSFGGQPLSSKDGVRSLRTITVRGKSAHSYAKRNADVIIRITDSSKLEINDYDKPFADKIVNLNLSDLNVDNFLQEVLEMLSKNPMAVIHFDSAIWDSQIIDHLADDVTINEELQRLYKNYLDNHKIKISLDQFSSEKHGLQQARHNAALAKLYKILHGIFSIDVANNINGLTFVLDDKHKIVPKLISYINNYIYKLAGSDSPIYSDSAMYVAQSYYGSAQFKQQIGSLSYSINKLKNTIDMEAEAELYVQRMQAQQEQQTVADVKKEETKVVISIVEQSSTTENNKSC